MMLHPKTTISATEFEQKWLALPVRLEQALYVGAYFTIHHYGTNSSHAQLQITITYALYIMPLIK